MTTPPSPIPRATRPAPLRRRDAVVVTVAAGGVLLFWLLLMSDPVRPGELPRAVGLVVGLVLAGALWWRRSAPSALMVAAVLTSPFEAAALPQLIALFGFARVRPRESWPAAALMVIGATLPVLAREGWTGMTMANVVMTMAINGTVVAAAVAETRDDDRTALDRLGDVAVYAVAWLVNLAVLAVGVDAGAVDVVPALGLELAAVTALTVGLWFRRDWPVPLAMAAMVIAPFAQFGLGTFLVAVFVVASRARTPTALLIAAGYVAATAVHVVLVPDVALRPATAAVLATLAYGAAVGWGLVARSRRQLLDSWRERARQAEAEQSLRMEAVRRLERERIAREMHDVLAHRLSLLSVHAGALEYRPGAPPEQVAAAATVIRENAHRALDDLREVIGVLRRGPDTDQPDRPQPTLHDLGALIDEAARVGVTISSDVSVDADTVPERIGRTAYRVVQEALTNARKHAPAAPVSVRVSGAAGAELTVEVANPVVAVVGAGASAESAADIPGAQSGLIGLRERVDLAGGTFSGGVGPDDLFVVVARLPWPA